VVDINHRGGTGAIL